MTERQELEGDREEGKDEGEGDTSSREEREDGKEKGEDMDHDGSSDRQIFYNNNIENGNKVRNILFLLLLSYNLYIAKTIYFIFLTQIWFGECN